MICIIVSTRLIINSCIRNLIKQNDISYLRASSYVKFTGCTSNDFDLVHLISINPLQLRLSIVIFPGGPLAIDQNLNPIIPSTQASTPAAHISEASSTTPPTTGARATTTGTTHSHARYPV